MKPIFYTQKNGPQMCTKSQIEIMGLVVIVLIITVVFLFSITLQAKSKTSTTSAFSNDQLATNYLIALLKTDHVECGTQVENLIFDCATDQRIRCKDATGTEHDSCYFAKDLLDQILPNSLGPNKLNAKYRLTIAKITSAGSTPEDLLGPWTDHCEINQNKGMQGYQPISLYPKYPNGRVDVTLDICN